MSKQEATRLADHIRIDQDWCEEAAALLRRWPDGKPYCYIYEWDTPGGVHQDTTHYRWNGALPARAISVYTAPPAKPDGEPVAARCPDCIGAEHPGWRRGMRCVTCDGTATVAAPPGESEPNLGMYKDAIKQVRGLHERIAALEEELSSVLSDWNDIVKASGSPTNGGAVGHVAAMVRRIAALEAQVAAEAKAFDAAETRIVELEAARKQALVALEGIVPDAEANHFGGPDTANRLRAAREAIAALRAIEGVQHG